MVERSFDLTIDSLENPRSKSCCGVTVVTGSVSSTLFSNSNLSSVCRPMSVVLACRLRLPTSQQHRRLHSAVTI